MAPREALESDDGLNQAEPSWERIVDVIRASAEHQPAEIRHDLEDWADFVHGCAELRGLSQDYQKKP